ncbi:hypothetical protein PENSTE_c001G05707, partial [Penicillium steckii]
MTDLTPTLNKLLSAKNAKSTQTPTSFSPADEFLKEAHRIVRQPNPTLPLTPLRAKQSRRTSKSNKYTQNSHITSLSKYLTSIRHAYLSTNTPSRRQQPNTPHTHSQSQPQNQNQPQSQNLTDPERDAIDSSTALLLRDLASSITNLSDAETLRKKTATQLLHKKYGHSAAGALLLRWASGNEDGHVGGKSEEQVDAEEREKTISSVREGVLWFLRRGLDFVVDVQRGMVEKRIERVREKEKSVLYKAMKGGGVPSSTSGFGSGSGSSLKDQGGSSRDTRGYNDQNGVGSSIQAPSAAVLSEADSREIEGQLSAEQLQLFAEENDSMLKHYEDTLGKV